MQNETKRLIGEDFITVERLKLMASYYSQWKDDNAKQNVEALQYAINKIENESNKSEYMKVFISLPMNGKTDEQILEERANAFAKIKSTNPSAELIDTFIDENLSENHKGLKYLSKSIEMLDEADAVWMLKGWETAKGCKIERDCALAYGLPVYYLY